MTIDVSRALALLDRARSIIAGAAKAAAETYATGRFRQRPIVSRHFTAGNQGRYGWPPLSRQYFMAKARGITRKGWNAVLSKHLKGRRGAKLDKSAEFSSGTGELVGIGSATNLPMLVNTGALRDAVENQAQIVPRGTEHVDIIFSVPDYGMFLHEGTGRMPKRSPVEPNNEDVETIRDEVQKQIDLAIGKGRVTFQS